MTSRLMRPLTQLDEQIAHGVGLEAVEGADYLLSCLIDTNRTVFP